MLTPVELLRKLGNGVRPGSEKTTNAQPPFDTLSFDSIMQMVETGEISSGRAVRINAALGIELDDEQMDALSRGLDGAEAAGLSTLHVVADAALLAADVQGRELTGAHEAGSSLVRDIQAVLVLPARQSDGEQDEENTENGGGPAGARAKRSGGAMLLGDWQSVGTVRNTSVVGLLNLREGAQPDGHDMRHTPAQ